ncbi:hypothetical protein ALI22I_23920 [Saccharothrix sp. ALI-22-I]|uniref:hypothetical protein n=1 Tax=Saccharothrix sp. ALI-22-I TaxID=1933778 RepID=UPI00097BBD87|nr:hypothetical protein [Saccharothrix sp. ALI-22-I]ONI86680.1 hypothetical protein ALI22I_23920 [Saccharothrix sp. ALI-22-I]
MPGNSPHKTTQTGDIDHVEHTVTILAEVEPLRPTVQAALDAATATVDAKPPVAVREVLAEVVTGAGLAAPARPTARRDTLVFTLDAAPVPDWVNTVAWANDHADAPLRLTITCTRTGHQPRELREDVHPEPGHPHRAN